MSYWLWAIIASGGSMLGASLGTLMFAIPRQRRLSAMELELARLRVEMNIHQSWHWRDEC